VVAFVNVKYKFILFVYVYVSVLFRSNQFASL